MYIVLCQEGKRNIVMLDIHDQNTMLVFASKGTQAMYLNSNFQSHQRVQLNQIVP